MTNEPNIAELLRDVKRTIAIAKMAAFEGQAYRLGEYVAVNLLPPAKASEVLYDAALANNLVAEHGADLIQQIMAEGLSR